MPEPVPFYDKNVEKELKKIFGEDFVSPSEEEYVNAPLLSLDEILELAEEDSKKELGASEGPITSISQDSL